MAEAQTFFVQPVNHRARAQTFFITRFNREALTVDEVDDKLLLAAFHNRINSDLFIHKLYEKVPQSMAELVHSTQNFMNAEDPIIAKKRKKDERMEANPM